MTTVLDKVRQLEVEVNAEVFERREEIHGAIIALLAKKHHFQVGPPGTAKSFLVTRLVKRIDFPTEDAYFHWLMTQYSTPPELYGGPILPLLKEGRYKLNTAKKLPRAYVAFLDEIFKGNGSILNANLMIMNERIFYNDDDPSEIPLISMFGASNELPESDALKALWDRLHMRFLVDTLQETTNKMRMLRGGKLSDPKKVISLGELEVAHKEVEAVIITEGILETLNKISEQMRPLGLSVTERRLNDCLDVIRAEAWLNGNAKANEDDMKPLMHVLWEKTDHRMQIRKLVFQASNPIDRKADDIRDTVREILTEFQKVANDPDTTVSVAKQSMESMAKLKRVKNEKELLVQEAIRDGRTSTILVLLHDEIQEAHRIVISGGFGLDESVLNTDGTVPPTP